MRFKWIGSMVMIILVLTGLFAYQEGNSDVYEGMSIIPEEEEDIPLYEGLTPKRNTYVIEGNQVDTLYSYYIKELSNAGWKLAMEDRRESSFRSVWEKEEFSGELNVRAHYEKTKGQTAMVFDHHPSMSTTTWIEQPPSSMCVYVQASDENCTAIKDPRHINDLMHIINQAIDVEHQSYQTGYEKSELDAGGQSIMVYHAQGKPLYFESEQGMKMMKPESDFFELTNIPH
ncbi:hypothetical protein ACFFGV_14790 [Pontibacillus salicampi]|uniref:DUF3298 domain-containing protein n=1 Tax=Pontibacillus salicampi TaxID=1449801 RepID=A0ABV6LR01_9BACI